MQKEGAAYLADPVRRVNARALEEDGHQIPTAGLVSSQVKNQEGELDPHDVYKRDTAWIRDSDLLIAEVTTPSHGVGYEIGFALKLRKQVLCLYQKGKPISKMITGNPDPKLTTFAYTDVQEALHFSRNYLKKIPSL